MRRQRSPARSPNRLYPRLAPPFPFTWRSSTRRWASNSQTEAKGIALAAPAKNRHPGGRRRTQTTGWRDRFTRYRRCPCSLEVSSTVSSVFFETLAEMKPWIVGRHLAGWRSPPQSPPPRAGKTESRPPSSIRRALSVGCAPSSPSPLDLRSIPLFLPVDSDADCLGRCLAGDSPH